MSQSRAHVGGHTERTKTSAARKVMALAGVGITVKGCMGGIWAPQRRGVSSSAGERRASQCVGEEGLPGRGGGWSHRHRQGLHGMNMGPAEEGSILFCRGRRASGGSGEESFFGRCTGSRPADLGQEEVRERYMS